MSSLTTYLVQSIRQAIVVLLAATLLTGVIYPLAVTLAARSLFPDQAEGSLIVRDGQVVGSAWIGQSFHRPEYFWGRPSATAPFPYNAAASGGSNLGPSNPLLVEQVRKRLNELEAAGTSVERIPVDLVTASASGLDPHISPEAAEVQVSRVASRRGIREDEVRRLVAAHTEGRQFGVLGEPRVNVLKLNLALDAVAAATSPSK